MDHISDRTERLIVRKLDGEITPEEELELDRELMRSPVVRDLFESYKQIDGLSAEVLDACVGNSREVKPLLVVPASRPPAPGRSRSWMVYASAVAACLALAIFWHTPKQQTPQNIEGTTGIARNAAPSANLVTNRVVPGIGNWGGGGGGGGDGGVWNVADRPAQRLQRKTDRNVIVIPGKDGNIYLLNVDRVREVNQPAEQNKAPFGRDPV